ncbi:uncharacterized protein PHACADRAFT_249138 [Phanerochaete carnosa HHB-10118-sp]|uniref:Uncharacterized protein n=1 Tax=Phanerochaete carnosa (strain HHB-10118-sp) TaxID=650164 RepID=K5V870_PHACS|nr:uncharacterized protein PHACADRAFT_249138 [Phanerochaete carnosa HHB-10118-sp]EKM58986.1 hypothetical protein PHACADRAFT_249138 [Phanerochaete carnosa HHB-10118-sp]
MGEFKCQHRRSVDVAAFKRLSREMQCAVLARVDTNQTTREESATMLRNGGVPLTQLTLRRVGYDERFQAALLKVHARFGPSARDEDVEDFEEDCDEEK